MVSQILKQFPSFVTMLVLYKVSIFMTAYWVFPVSFLTVDKGRTGFLYIQKTYFISLIMDGSKNEQDDRFHKKS